MQGDSAMTIEDRTPDMSAVYWPRGRKTIAYQPVSERLPTLDVK